jgi:predicted SAM-dependent methyltransferase
MDLRDCIRTGMDFANKTTLEIGPLYRPFVLRSEGDVIYVDHADTETLRRKYADDPLFDVSDIVDVDAVWGEQTLAECLGNRRVDYVIASHVIEHVPDMVTWLQELRSVLRDGGEIRLVIPDKRFTFDYTRRLTVFSDVLDAHLRKARRPLSLYIIDHILNVRRVDTGAAWRSHLDEESLPRLHSYDMAIGVARDALETEHYHDVHCWVFTPRTFARLMRECAENHLIDLACVEFKDTLYGSLEFTAFLRASTDKQAMIESWRKMERDVSDRTDTLSTHAELSAALAREAELRAALEESRATASAYASSTSWKLTAPLRALVRLIRRH